MGSGASGILAARKAKKDRRALDGTTGPSNVECLDLTIRRIRCKERRRDEASFSKRLE